MDWYYANERPIPDAQAHRYGRTDRDTAQAILSEFFTLTPDGWQHKRIEAEIAAYNAKAEKNREVGKLGGRPKASANPEITMVVSERLAEKTMVGTETNPSHKPLANNHHKSEEQILRPADAEPLPDRFADFWQVYPDKTGRKPSAEKWKAKRLDAIADRIIADVRARAASDRKWLDGFVPNPMTYLNQERWNDPIQPRMAGPPQPMGKQASGVLALLEQANGKLDTAGNIDGTGEALRLEPRRLSGVRAADNDGESLGRMR